MNSSAKDFKSGFDNAEKSSLSILTLGNKEAQHAAFMMPMSKLGFDNYLSKPSLKLSG